MSNFRLSDLVEHVHTCAPTQGGDFLIITRKGKTATSPVEIPAGATVRINGGKATRAGK